MLFNFFESPYFPIVSDYAKILIPSFFTYRFAKHKFLNDKKHEIFEKQFLQVYLPLFLSTKQYLNPDLPKYTLYIRKTERLIYKNYPLVFPKTIKLFNKFKSEIESGSMNAYHISQYEYQITSDYNKLRGKLGYPTDSLIARFKRLNAIDKFLYLTSIVLAILLILSVPQILLAFLEGNIFDLVIALFGSIMNFLMLYVIYYIVSH